MTSGKILSARSTSSSVLNRDMLNRIAPWAMCGSMPMACRTCDGSSEPLLPAEQLGPQAHFSAHVNRPYALGPVKLVRRQGQQLHRQLVRIERQLAHRLRRVHMQRNGLGSGDLAELLDGENDAGLIIGVH